MAESGGGPNGGAPSRCDVAIVGGGLAGAALAAALAATGASRREIVLIERSPGDPREAPDPRSIALSRASCALLRRIGAWDALAERAWPLKRVCVSQAGGAFLALNADELGWDALGCVVEYPELLFALRARARSAARWIAAECADVAFSADAARLAFGPARDAGGEAADASLDAALLVAADGRRSAIRERLGIATRVRPAFGARAGAAALVARLTLPDAGIAHTAHERFVPGGGVVALLPLAPQADGARAKLVWTHDAESVSALAERPERLLERVRGALGDLTGPLPAQRIEPAVYPLSAAEAAEWTRRRLALIGDAAHTLHPIGAQGLNLALRDVAALASALGAIPPGRDIGELAVLASYERARRADHAWTGGFVGALSAIAQRAGWPRDAAVRLGIETLRFAPIARARLIREAAGVGDFTGRWMREPAA